LVFKARYMYIAESVFSGENNFIAVFFNKN